MTRSLLLMAAIALHGAEISQQLVVVTATDFNATMAQMIRYEYNGKRFIKVGTTANVNLGRHGMGWGRGIMDLKPGASEPCKHEGDGKAPAGVFSLNTVFGYAVSYPTAMPYLYASDDLICVDDGNDTRYNRILHTKTLPKSFEWMHRNDGQYELGIVVNHNTANISGMGSCIFMHVQKAPQAPTAGCTSMAKKTLRQLVRWLDPAKKPLLIQLPLSHCDEAAAFFKGINCQAAD